MHTAVGWATCPITQSWFVRISANPAIISQAVSVRVALLLLARIAAHKDHVFSLNDLPLTDSTRVPADLLIGHRQVTGAYLLGLAVQKGGKLATLDRKVASMAPRGSAFADAVELVPVR